MIISMADIQDEIHTLVSFCKYHTDGVWETNHWRFPPSGGECSPPELPTKLLRIDEKQSYRYWTLAGDFMEIKDYLQGLPVSVFERFCGSKSADEFLYDLLQEPYE